jgi:hypothetical protein
MLEPLFDRLEPTEVKAPIVLVEAVGGKNEFESECVPVDKMTMGVRRSPLSKATGQALGMIIGLCGPVNFAARNRGKVASGNGNN